MTKTTNKPPLKTPEMYGHEITDAGTCARCCQRASEIPGLGEYWHQPAVCWGAPLDIKELVRAAAAHDWSYAHSDDRRRRWEGWKQWREISELIERTGTKGELIASLWKLHRTGEA